MKIIILVGGKGTRIQELDSQIPKCLIKIGQYPILEHIMQQYALHYYNDFLLCLGYQGQAIKQYFLNYGVRSQDFRFNLVTFHETQQVEFLIGKRHETDSYLPDYNITFAETGLNSNKIKRLLLVQRYLLGEKYNDTDDSFMLTYGDGISNVNITELIKFHKDHGKIGTITTIMPKDRFGRLGIDPDKKNQIISFYEKQQTFEWINGGFMIFQIHPFFQLLERLLKTFPTADLETDFLPYLSSKNELHAFPHDGYWQQMDTPKDYELLQEAHQNGEF